MHRPGGKQWKTISRKFKYKQNVRGGNEKRLFTIKTCLITKKLNGS